VILAPPDQHLAPSVYLRWIQCMPASDGRNPLAAGPALRDNRRLLRVGPVAALAGASEYLEPPSAIDHRIITRDYHRSSASPFNRARKLGASHQPRKVGSGHRLRLTALITNPREAALAGRILIKKDRGAWSHWESPWLPSAAIQYALQQLFKSASRLRSSRSRITVRSSSGASIRTVPPQVNRCSAISRRPPEQNRTTRSSPSSSITCCG